MAKAKILIAEDELASRVGLQELLAGWGYEVTAAADGQEALEKAAEFQPSLIIADLVMPKMDGISLLRTLKTDGALPSLIILTGQGTIETAVQAMQEGAYDYLTKPVDVGRLRVLVEKALERGAVLKEVRLLRHQVRHLGRFGPLVGDTRAMREVYRLLELAAPSTAPVLICGGSGTGKSWQLGRFTISLTESTAPSSRSTALLFRRRCWKVRSSAMRKGPLQALPNGGWDALNSRMAEPSFLMRSRR